MGLLIPLVVALLLWSLWRRGAVPYQGVLLKLFTPDDWWWGGTLSPKGMEGSEARVVYDGVFFAVLVWADRRGAARRIRDPLGGETVLTRGEAAYPALVTEVRSTNARSGLSAHKKT